MEQTITNNPRLSVQFSHDDDVRGRDTITHPISGSQRTKTITMTLPLTTTATTESSKSHRSSLSMSLSAFAGRLRSRSRSHSRSRSRSRPESRNSLEAPDNNGAGGSKLTRRRSHEVKGEYADVARAQRAYMENLREEQARNNITHNIDQLPIPFDQEHDHRRWSWSHVFGMDKPLLAR
ncbi:hypothetical protein B0O80DRAFT_484939 [Mortierella sp. GBAus27b]|nr:hypothetical protein B0O80DRAFT_484939 [Mortierella sp. GBAus27b]